MKTPHHLMIREFRLSANPTEFGWRNYAQPSEATPVSIEFGYEQKDDGSWWYWRETSDEPIIVNLPALDIANQSIAKIKLWHGPYPDEQMCVERMERERRFEAVPNASGAVMQNVNAPTERSMINDIFGAAGKGVAGFVPRR